MEKNITLEQLKSGHVYKTMLEEGFIVELPNGEFRFTPLGNMFYQYLYNTDPDFCKIVDESNKGQK